MLYCISVNYRTADSSLRGSFAMNDREQVGFLKNLKESGCVNGGVVLSTCNRSEIYLASHKSCMEAAVTALSDMVSPRGVSEAQIRKVCLFYEDSRSVRHLFRVAGGLDSMVLGETEILRQVREAYEGSAANGFADREINMIFQDALAYAKRARTETEISATPVSVGTLAANRIFSYLKEKNLKKCVMVIGAAGRTGNIVVKNLLAKGIDVIGTSRLYGVEQENKAPFTKVHTKRRYDILSDVSAVVSATASPHYLLTLEEYSGKVGCSEEKLLIDLAVPADIDGRLASYGRTELLTIDDIRSMAAHNNALLLDEAQKAEILLESSLDDTLKKICFARFCAEVDISKTEKWYRKMLFYLRDRLTAQEFSRFLESELRNRS